jgi:hypothetical protein
MPAETTSALQFIPSLQTAIGPAILISGSALLLLTMTNRLGRTIDRARSLISDFVTGDPHAKEKIQAELVILWKRARIIRLAISLVSISALCAALLIIVLFLTTLWHLELNLVISVLFLGCLTCLIGSLVVFIHDTNRSLAALKVELNFEGLPSESPGRASREHRLRSDAA